jgi:Tfp pilus assembly protein PilF
MLRKSFIFIAIITLAFSACRQALPEKSSENYSAAVKSFYVGLAALQVGDDQRANQELTKAANLADGEPAVWNNLGVLQLRQKDFENAAQSLEKAKMLAPENAHIYTNLSVLETQLGNFEKSIQNLNKTIELEPNKVQAIYTLAQEQ